MKNKKIFKTILLIAIILLAVGCGLASCKKTKAYDVIVNEDNERSWLGVFSGALGIDPVDGNSLPSGQRVNASIGDTYNGDFYLSNANISYTWTTQTNPRPIITFNFYRLANEDNITLQVLTYVDDGAVLNTYDIGMTDQQFVIVFFRPGSEGFDYPELTFSICMSNSAPQNANHLNIVHIRDYNVLIGEESYTNGLDDNVFKLIRTTPLNCIVAVPFTLNGVPLGEDFIDLFNIGRLDLYSTPQIDQFIYRAYQGGNTNGYNEGYSAGSSASSEESYQDGYNVGYSVGMNRGEQIGYNRGYDAGASGDNAVSSFINILTSIFTGIGAIFSIELFPHITIGLFLLVPLFFGVLGLILWIWRHN